MNFEPNPRQAFVMLYLLITHEEPMQSKVPLSTFTTADRKELVDVGLIYLEQRKSAKHLILTDKAWDWASMHLDAPISKTQQAAPLLQTLLCTLKAFLQAQDMPLVELLTAKGPRMPPPIHRNGNTPSAETINLPEQIISAYKVVSGGQFYVDVRLAALRAQLPDFSREEMDEVLHQMQLDGLITLMRLDDPQSITAEDAAAALDVHGDKRHVAYVKG